MPQVSKKRKAAFLRWISRKKQTNQATVRSGDPPTDPDIDEVDYVELEGVTDEGKIAFNTFSFTS